MKLSYALKTLVAGSILLLGICISAERQDSSHAQGQIQALKSEVYPMESFLPDKVGSLRRMGKPRAYDKDNLYEYIDGHAEFFISAGFNRLAVGNYSATGSEDGVPDVIVEIYDMVKNIQAFGVLSDESSGEAVESSQSSFGTENTQGMNFTRGKYFVKILSFSAEVPVKLFQEQIGPGIRSVKEEIPEFSRFPDVGKVVKTRFVRESYRGLPFLKDVLERKYVSNGKSFDIAMVMGDRDQIKKVTETFINYFSQSDVKYSEDKKNGWTVYQVKDPYEGDWVLIPLSDVIFGIYGTADDAVIAKILSGGEK